MIYQSSFVLIVGLAPVELKFLVWCYYPKTQGAKIIYTSAIKPYVVPALGIDQTAKKED